MANTSVFGIYPNRADLEIAVDRLRVAGFRAADISILLPENLGSKDIAVAGAVGAAGGLIGAIAGFGIPEYEAKRYEGRIRKGGILLSVHADDSEWTSKAKEILEETGAEDVSSSSEAHADYAASDRPTLRR